MESAIGKALSFGGNVGRSIKKFQRRPEEPPDLNNPIVDNKGMKNDYFSVKFQEDNEYLDALFKGPWTIFGHYLTVWRWTPAFSTDQVQPQNFMAWIRLLGLPEGMYTKSLLRFIGSVVGSVAKIDRNIDNNVRGKFVWLVVYMDLEKPLVSKVKIDGKIQRVEYESLLWCDLSVGDLVIIERTVRTRQVKEYIKGRGESTIESRGRNSITDGGVIGGSRFGVLNGNYGGEFWKQSNDLNGNNGSRILGKAKGKRDVTANGPKSNLNTLKPSKKVRASSSDPKNNPFDDGSRMGPIVSDKDLEAIHVQAFSPVLNGKKIWQLDLWLKQGFGLVVENTTVIEPASFTGGDSLSLPIALVIDDILQGLSNEVGDDIAMVDVLGKEIEEEDETIVDVDST
ncbi:hypothetical protein Gorai_024467 [Gossypium raimondii]|uniref:DUF4283 domain-containing protein n=1 Tax=Gossypium raimondii TaxID=29730 RepID=A0A7J8NZJ7_GOSRA|nr:hypothetical protein [Gossypium raimondii]